MKSLRNEIIKEIKTSNWSTIYDGYRETRVGIYKVGITLSADSDILLYTWTDPITQKKNTYKE